MLVATKIIFIFQPIIVNRIFVMYTFILILSILSCEVQEGFVTQIKEPDIVALINSLESGDKYKTGSFNILIFKKSNPSGSAKTVGTHEVTHSYLIGISEFDEYPKQSLFIVGDFMNPVIEDVIENESSIRITIKHGNVNNRKSNEFEIYQHTVVTN